MVSNSFLFRLQQWDLAVVRKWNIILKNSSYQNLVKWTSPWFSAWHILTFGLIFTYIGVTTDNYYALKHFFGTICFGMLLFSSIKYLVRRKRPYMDQQGVERLDYWQGHYSFPSGHSFWFSLTLLFVTNFWGIPWWGIIGFFLFSIIMSLERILLGMHYPTDLIVGHSLALIVFLCYFPVFSVLWLWILALF
jgi:membrane-associated phospholipid phosphatase